ncbi:homogentisate phytyltransferase [[Limnothrix rosea] IAM M-220]|nr:homogentisate phytyltransferase [[Limnothrix rosea] IAM M-220]
MKVPSLSVNSPSRPKPFWRSLWQFSRPHTIIGTSLSVWALAFLANSPEQLFGLYGWFVLTAWIACLGGNVFIVGLNQLTDIDIDKINKPHLPVAAGEFSAKTGWLIVLLSGAIALLLSIFSGLWLTVTVVSSLAIGTMYSLPPVRLKRFPLLAAMCIFTVRGVVVNLGLFAHFRDISSQSVVITPTVWLLTAFIIVFTVAIAIFKDVPDMEGDQQYRIKTFTLLLGKRKIFNLSLGIIGACYLGMIAGVWLLATSLNPLVFTIAHMALAIALIYRSQRVNLAQKQEIAAFYQFIWKLFFLEYILFIVVNLLP